MRTLTRRSWLWLAGALVPAVALAGSASTPIAYSTTFPDANGAQKQVSFSGTASGTSLTGTLTVAGVSQKVSATIATDGSLIGNVVAANGKLLGTFSGKPNGPSSTAGTYSFNGQTGQWSVPLRVSAPSSP